VFLFCDNFLHLGELKKSNEIYLFIYINSLFLKKNSQNFQNFGEFFFHNYAFAMLLGTIGK